SVDPADEAHRHLRAGRAGGVRRHTGVDAVLRAGDPGVGARLDEPGRRDGWPYGREFGGISTRERSHRRDQLVKSTEDLGASKKVRRADSSPSMSTSAATSSSDNTPA